MYNMVTIADNTVLYNWNLLRQESLNGSPPPTKKKKKISMGSKGWINLSGGEGWGWGKSLHRVQEYQIIRLFTLPYSFISQLYLSKSGKDPALYYISQLCGWPGQFFQRSYLGPSHEFAVRRQLGWCSCLWSPSVCFFSPCFQLSIEEALCRIARYWDSTIPDAGI